MVRRAVYECLLQTILEDTAETFTKGCLNSYVSLIPLLLLQDASQIERAACPIHQKQENFEVVVVVVVVIECTVLYDGSMYFLYHQSFESKFSVRSSKFEVPREFLRTEYRTHPTKCSALLEKVGETAT